MCIYILLPYEFLFALVPLIFLILVRYRDELANKGHHHEQKRIVERALNFNMYCGLFRNGVN